MESTIVLSGEQQALFKIMEESSQNLFITGRAGAGKSVLLRHLRENTKKRIMVAAPTGIAALNVQGQTIHSLFRLGYGLHEPGNFLEPNERLYTLLKRVDTLVIDEISMTRADLLDAIDSRFRSACNNDLPFGGKQIIMFGDVYQLPPVIEKDLVKYFEKVHGGGFFFNALVWQKVDFKIFELTQVFRQKDPVFKDVLNAIRDGSFVDSQIETLNARYGVPIPDDGKTVTLAPTNALVTNINQKRLDQLEGQVYEYRATVMGQIKKGNFPTEEILQLKKGAQVVLLQNDKDKRWVNGTVCTISHLEKYSAKNKTEEKIIVNVDGLDYPLEKATWEEISYKYDEDEGKVKSEVVSSFTQYPIRLAWALTIHKSQGQTYKSVALDLTTGTFAAGQMYVALSRATSLEGLYLKMPVLRKHIIVDPKVKEFMSRKEPEFVEVAEEPKIVDASESRQDDQESPVVVEAVNPTSETSKAENRGRRPTEQSDKVVKSEFRSAPAMKAALSDFVEQLANSDFHELLPDAGDVLSFADVVNAALMSYAPFRDFFEQSEHYAEYQSWKERQQARQAYKTRKRAAQSSQDDEGPDDPSGGGLAVPSLPAISEEARAINERALARGGWPNDILTPAGRAMLTGQPVLDAS